MNILLVFAIAAGCILAERLWPAMELPRVNNWWGRVILTNSIQLMVTVLAGQTWNRWLSHWSLLHLSASLPDTAAATFAYVFSTFVYYWWHRFRHESRFLWRALHRRRFARHCGDKIHARRVDGRHPDPPARAHVSPHPESLLRRGAAALAGEL